MAPERWDDSDEESTPPSSPPPVVASRPKFADEEDDDVLESWDAAEDSEEEREKEKKAAAAKAKAEAEAKANHKSKSQRIEAHIAENQRRKLEEDDDSSEDEDEAERRARLKKAQKEADLKNAEELFGNIGISDRRAVGKAVVVEDPDDPTQNIDLSKLRIFNPNTKDQFTKLRETLVPLIGANAKKAQYTLFLQEFSRQLAKDLPSEQIKKISSALTTMSNEKMKEEKAAEKGGKKSKAAKTKTSLVAARDTSYKADTTSYDDGLQDDDFM